MAEQKQQNNISFDIREVWEDNLYKEFSIIRDVVDRFPYVSMDTEFPGCIFPRAFVPEHIYYNLKKEVNAMHLIQLGLTFFDDDGNMPTMSSNSSKAILWQFNFREFNPDFHFCNQDSIRMLKHSAGINFYYNMKFGVKASKFAELLMSSGAVLNDSVKWVAFDSKYDLGYLIKILTGGVPLPETRREFLDRVRVFCPTVIDVKHLTTVWNDEVEEEEEKKIKLYGKLETIAGKLGVRRTGRSHQAGSDSLLTAHVFMIMKKEHFDGAGGAEQHVNVFPGVNDQPAARAIAGAASRQKLAVDLVSCSQLKVINSRYP